MLSPLEVDTGREVFVRLSSDAACPLSECFDTKFDGRLFVAIAAQ